jgi:hypothetical protein
MIRMYRDPVESLSAECARLRAELERAQVDADVARRMTAPQRTIWTVAAVCAIVASVVVCVFFALAEQSAVDDVRDCRSYMGSMQNAVDNDRRAYMELYERLNVTRDTLEACQDNLADTLKCDHHGCQPGDPLCEPAPVNRAAMR